MTEGEAVRAVRLHFESAFPKTCNNCGRHFATLRDYILSTRRLGPAISYDAELGDWEPTEPLGSQALANCPCGSTLALSTEGMALPTRLALLNWVKDETQRRNVSASEFLEHVRNEIRRQVLSEPSAPDER